MDILKRLSEYNPPDMVSDEMMQEIAIDIQDAKNEIERLREALKAIACINPSATNSSYVMRDTALSALKQKESE